MIEQIDHVAIAVHNIDASLPYYTEQLGLAVIHDEEVPSAGVRMVYLAAGPALIQLVQPIGESPIRDFLEQKGEGLHHLCFSVKSIPDTLAALDGERDASITVGGRSRRTCFLSAKPNNVTVELTEIDPYAGG